MSTLPTDRLARLIEDRHACLLELRELGQRQRQCIEGGQMTQLIRLLGSKQHLLATLQSIERGLAPFRNEEPEERVWRTGKDREQCAALADTCRKLLDEIVHQERENESLMTRERHRVAHRLGEVNTAARASGAYRMHMRGRSAPSQMEEFPLRTHPAATEQEEPATNTIDLSSDIR